MITLPINLKLNESCVSRSLANNSITITTQPIIHPYSIIFPSSFTNGYLRINEKGELSTSESTIQTINAKNDGGLITLNQYGCGLCDIIFRNKHSHFSLGSFENSFLLSHIGSPLWIAKSDSIEFLTDVKIKNHIILSDENFRISGTSNNIDICDGFVANGINIGGITNYGNCITLGAHNPSPNSIAIGTAEQKKLSIGDFSIDIQTLKDINWDKVLQLDQNLSSSSNPEFNNMILNGNLLVRGEMRTLNVEYVYLSNNMVILNDGEIGDGVSVGLAGIEINRGNLPPYYFLYDEKDDWFKVGMEDDLQIICTRRENMLDGALLEWNSLEGRVVPSLNKYIVKQLENINCDITIEDWRIVSELDSGIKLNSSSGFIKLRAHNCETYELYFPRERGIDRQFMVNDGNGNLLWNSISDLMLDDTLIISNSDDPTKSIIYDISKISPQATRKIVFPDRDLYLEWLSQPLGKMDNVEFASIKLKGREFLNYVEGDNYFIGKSNPYTQGINNISIGGDIDDLDGSKNIIIGSSGANMKTQNDNIILGHNNNVLMNGNIVIGSDLIGNAIGNNIIIGRGVKLIGDIKNSIVLGNESICAESNAICLGGGTLTRVGICKANPSCALDVAGSAIISGTINGRNIISDGTLLDMYKKKKIGNLSASQVQQIINMRENIIQPITWNYLADIDQHLSTFSNVEFGEILSSGIFIGSEVDDYGELRLPCGTSFGYIYGNELSQLALSYNTNNNFNQDTNEGNSSLLLSDGAVNVALNGKTFLTANEEGLYYDGKFSCSGSAKIANNKISEGLITIGNLSILGGNANANIHNSNGGINLIGDELGFYSNSSSVKISNEIIIRGVVNLENVKYGVATISGSAGLTLDYKIIRVIANIEIHLSLPPASKSAGIEFIFIIISGDEKVIIKRFGKDLINGFPKHCAINGLYSRIRLVCDGNSWYSFS